MEKNSLRKIFLQKRMDLTEEQISICTDLIIKQLDASFQFTKVETVHIFLPQHQNNELDTWQIIKVLRDKIPAIRIAAPRIIPGTREMQHYILDAETQLISNRWNIPEPDPDTSKSVTPEEIDIVILPLLAFDMQGFRVGYGGGYYDRFLAKCRPDALKIGICFFDPVDVITDNNEYDIRMDCCITPQKTWKW